MLSFAPVCAIGLDRGGVAFHEGVFTVHGSIRTFLTGIGLERIWVGSGSGFWIWCVVLFATGGRLCICY